jgi:hypothetical protein
MKNASIEQNRKSSTSNKFAEMEIPKASTRDNQNKVKSLFN